MKIILHTDSILWKPYLSLIRKYNKLLQLQIVQHCSKLENKVCDIILSDDDTLSDLNLRFRNKNYATNVLSFGTVGVLGDIGQNIGEVYISYQAIERESTEYNQFFIERFIHIMTHGILHLIGYDHEGKEEQVEMENLEILILATVGISNPYL